MSSQADAWSRAAKKYHEHFIDPYRDDVHNPLFPALTEAANAGAKTVADFGCGAGPLLPFLAEHFERVVAVDFADGMLRRAKRRCKDYDNITYHRRSLTDIGDLPCELDVATSINSLVMPDVGDQEQSLQQILGALRPGGRFFAILPAMDAVHYQTMLLVDRARELGKPIAAARRNAGHFGEHELYDFAFGQFHFQGLEQHFWQPFEIRHRFKKTGFRRVTLSKIELSWKQFVFDEDMDHEPPPWDWFVKAVASKEKGKKKKEKGDRRAE